MNHGQDAWMTGSDDPWRVALSQLIAAITAFAAVSLTRLVHVRHGRARQAWLCSGAACMGAGIWCMHFVGMIAVSDDSSLIGLSLLTVMALSWLTLRLVTHASPLKLRIIVSGLLMGTGIAAMHYVGMKAMQMPAHIAYQAGLFVVSILIAIPVSIVALSLSSSRRDPGPRQACNAMCLLPLSRASLSPAGIAAGWPRPVSSHMTQVPQ